MTRKKIALITLAAALLLSISVVGSLMLFTDMTPTAKNTIEFGAGIQAKLVESGGKKDEEGNFEYTDKEIDGDFDGITFGPVAPGQILDKAPKVVRTDVDPTNAANAYVAGKATIVGYDKETDATVAYDNLDANLKLLLEDGNGFFKDWIKGQDDNWVFLPEKVGETASKSTGYFFYINEDSKQLKPLPPTIKNEESAEVPAFTDPIFQTIAIPMFEADKLEKFAESQGKEIRLQLDPWLVQVNNNKYNEDKNNYFLAFGAFDPTFEEAIE
jgi:hypothetical protein